MSPADDFTPSHPMLQVFKDIGKITTGIENLEKGQGELTEAQGEVNEKISGLHRTVADLVTNGDCEDHRTEIEERIEEVAICAGAAKAAVKEKPGLLAKAAANAGDITKILSLVAAVVIGLWAVHRFAARVETALDKSSGRHSHATKKLIQRLDTPQKPQVIYVPVTIKPDAGMRRRRRLRRTRRPRSKRATP